MIVIAHRYKAEGLKDTIGCVSGIHHLRHAMDRTVLSLKGDLDKVSFPQSFGDTQQSASHRNGLKLAFGSLAVFHHDEGCDGTAKMDARSAPLWVRLGKMCHSKINMARLCHTR